jgi:hypothetical protein
MSLLECATICLLLLILNFKILIFLQRWHNLQWWLALASVPKADTMTCTGGFLRFSLECTQMMESPDLVNIPKVKFSYIDTLINMISCQWLLILG